MAYYSSGFDAPMDNRPPYQPKYVMLNSNHSTNLRPPPQRRHVPRYHSNNHGKSSGNSCFRCLCCCLCFWLLLIIFLAAALFALYTSLDPEIPRYNVDRFDVKSFNVQPDFSLFTEFTVTVKSENPNKHIGFDYGKKSSVIVTYRDSPLCSGTIPAFHQPRQNTTLIPIVLKGKSEFGSGLQEALMQNRNTGRIPLLVEVRAPVALVIKEIPLRQVTVLINCSLVVDNLSPNKKAKILSSTYQYGIEL
ncbi:NDR1/HIN1-like protein 6 [Mercurialis annua]|uniref:NDR1/HIN1-like protein 6 n=1 Tax=Mercurialis annua TaxID=3986 RepID=UPI00215F57ED|nr:NDR1/HIN1-like protein 6 [Mercurialis annua]